MTGSRRLRELGGQLKQRAHALLGRESIPRGSVPPLERTPEVTSERFLFIGGLHRSGTSIVHRLLCEHPQMSGFQDTGVPEDEGQYLQSLFPIGRAFGGPGRFAFDPAASLDDLAATWTDEQTETLLREWGAYYDLSKPVLLEKSPPNLVRHAFLQRVFPDARFLFILRHPVCVALATRKWAKTTAVELLLHWHVAYRALARSALGEKVLIMRYEDFVADSRTHLQRIYDLVGAEPFEPAEAVSDHNGRYFAEWEAGCAREAALMRDAFPEVVRAFGEAGYLLEPPYVTPEFDPKRFLRGA